MRRQAVRPVAVLAGMLLAATAHAAPVPVVGQQVALPALAAAAGMPPAALAGKAVVVAWFASWCPFCMQEAPRLQRLYAANAQHVMVVGVNVERGAPDQADRVAQWVARFGWTFPVVRDAAALEQVLGKPKGVPALVVVSRDGRVQQVESGEMLEEDFDDIAASARQERR
jgi:thiol-disulfide isomerase/thioredoxin